MNLATAAVGLLALLALPGYSAAEEARLVVTGTGVASAAPDRAEVRAGSSVVRATARDALEESNRVVETMQRALTEAGVAPAQVRTVQFHVAPQHGNRSRGEEPAPVVGYRVVHVLVVTVDRVEDLGRLLDRLIASGANLIEGIQLTNRDASGLLDEARRRAVADGARRAEVLARAAGKMLGPLLQLHEGAAAIPFPPVIRAERAMAAAVPIAAGENEYQTSVTLEYALR